MSILVFIKRCCILTGHFCFTLIREKYINPRITSGYRCHINNIEKRRTSTNHMGKAMDFSFNIRRGQTKWKVCNDARDLLVEKSNCQIRWNKRNQKSTRTRAPRRRKRIYSRYLGAFGRSSIR